MGPYENYCDMHHASMIDLYESDAESEYVNYVMPQEHGSHLGCERLEISGECGFEVKYRKTPFSFSFSRYTQEELAEKKHNFELEKSPFNVLCIDYKLNGIGSNSCGPIPWEQYLFNETKFSFSFVICPKE